MYLLYSTPTLEYKISKFFQNEIIIDAALEIEEIFINSNAPEKTKKSLKLISVEYYSFDSILHRGQILIHKDLAKDIVEVFQIIKEKKFPIAKAIPINKYNWSDELSMADNNTSAFNYRYVEGTTKLSPHALGRAIDINPRQNPYIKGGKSYPANSRYDSKIGGTITANLFLVEEFTKRGWKWGGYWKNNKDYQHFEKLN
jgi:hypothetical protein